MVFTQEARGYKCCKLLSRVAAQITVPIVVLVLETWTTDENEDE
jgi:hypothetical protein